MISFKQAAKKPFSSNRKPTSCLIKQLKSLHLSAPLRRPCLLHRFFAVLQESQAEREVNADEEPRRFKVLLYLADGSLEVRPEYEPNDGHYHFPKLLSRQPLPRQRVRGTYTH
jgi:hypothetical protein